MDQIFQDSSLCSEDFEFLMIFAIVAEVIFYDRQIISATYTIVEGMIRNFFAILRLF